MPKIVLKGITKRFGKSVAVDNLDLTIEDGAFVTLLGPSGCGKTTTLRMIAGLETPTEGEIYIGDNLVFSSEKGVDVSADKRNIGFLFQNYALWPHMTVRKNITFGLENLKWSKSDINKRLDELLVQMHIEEYADRYPSELSGGQQQRVAIARTLASKPALLLMDEPLSNLDAKLRVEMRTAIKQIQNSIGITTVYVTHDQEEAMAVSDRIAVMNGGVIQHIGRPRDLYQRPANLFVATFIGHTNIFDAELIVRNGTSVIRFHEGTEVMMENILPEEMHQQKIKVSIRPEEFIISTDMDSHGMSATVDDCVFLGLNTHYFVHLDDGTPAEVIMESEINREIPKGARIRLGVKTEKINAFTEDGTRNVVVGVRNDLEEVSG